MKFKLNGCDISFIAEAPEDITLKELLKQTDRIQPEWCACGIRSLSPDEEKWDTEIFIEKDSVRLANEDVSAYIRDDGNWFKTKRGNK